MHDWTFLLGPGFIVGIGKRLLGYLMYRSGPFHAAWPSSEWSAAPEQFKPSPVLAIDATPSGASASSSIE